MASMLYSPKLWLARAHEARVLGEHAVDPEVKRQLADIAERYEQIARHAQEQADLKEKFISIKSGRE